jgi:hypothetical protein
MPSNRTNSEYHAKPAAGFGIGVLRNSKPKTSHQITPRPAQAARTAGVR